MRLDDPAQSRSPEQPAAAPSIGDYEDFTKMALDPGEVAALVAERGECVLNWTTSEGYPVGVVMAYVFRHGRFWTNCTATRKRVSALRVRPQAAVVVTSAAKMATFKGDAVIHSRTDANWDDVKGWFYQALAGGEAEPENPIARRLEEFLDGPHQVIIEIPASLVVSFDFKRENAPFHSGQPGNNPDAHADGLSCLCLDLVSGACRPARLVTRRDPLPGGRGCIRRGERMAGRPAPAVGGLPALWRIPRRVRRSGDRR